jgi:hypothetical protein
MFESPRAYQLFRVVQDHSRAHRKPGRFDLLKGRPGVSRLRASRDAITGPRAACLNAILHSERTNMPGALTPEGATLLLGLCRAGKLYEIKTVLSAKPPPVSDCAWSFTEMRKVK